MRTRHRYGCRHRYAIAIGIGYRNRYRDVIGIGMLVVLVSRRYLIGIGISSVSVYDRYEVYNSSLCKENRCRNLAVRVFCWDKFLFLTISKSGDGILQGWIIFVPEI